MDWRKGLQMSYKKTIHAIPWIEGRAYRWAVRRQSKLFLPKEIANMSWVFCSSPSPAKCGRQGASQSAQTSPHQRPARRNGDSLSEKFPFPHLLALAFIDMDSIGELGGKDSKVERWIPSRWRGKHTYYSLSATPPLPYLSLAYPNPLTHTPNN
jgi:hypothetical protein